MSEQAHEHASAVGASLAESARKDTAKAQAAIVAGALFDFAGFLTTRPTVFAVGSSQHPSPVLDAIKEWAALRGLSLDEADVQTWTEALQ